MSQQWKRFSTAAIVLTLATRLHADAVDDVVQKWMAAKHLPSVSLVIGREGKIVKQAVYGEASVELHVPATQKTVYPIASATKTFTSTAVFMLAGKGKFSLDDSITKLLPELPATWADVTVRHLVTHTSGVPDIAVQPGREPLIAATRAEALQKLATMPRPSATGEKWSYNQTNYMLLLMLVEKFGEKPFETFIRDTFFTPLEMKSTRFGDHDDVIEGRASMYEFREGALRPAQSRFPEFVRGAAGVNTTAMEWYRWVDGWAHGKFLPRKELDVLWSPAKLASGDPVRLGKMGSYGAGVVVFSPDEKRAVGHSGGGNAAFRYFIEDDLVVVVLTNGRTNPDEFLSEIGAAALAKK